MGAKDRGGREKQREETEEKEEEIRVDQGKT